MDMAVLGRLFYYIDIGNMAQRVTFYIDGFNFYYGLRRATPHERYEQLLRRCPGIVHHLNLQDIASFLNVSAKTISMIRKDITFGKD